MTLRLNLAQARAMGRCYLKWVNLDRISLSPPTPVLPRPRPNCLRRGKSASGAARRHGAPFDLSETQLAGNYFDRSNTSVETAISPLMGFLSSAVRMVSRLPSSDRKRGKVRTGDVGFGSKTGGLVSHCDFDFSARSGVIRRDQFESRLRDPARSNYAKCSISNSVSRRTLRAGWCPGGRTTKIPTSVTG